MLAYSFKCFVLAFLFLVLSGCDATAEDTSQAQADQKVLIIISNNGFFYQEYADPRLALETAGFTVEVAAATSETAYPHVDSGEPDGTDGSVVPDFALEDVDSSDYAALVIAGGWGANHYYFAYDGVFDQSEWSPLPTHATRVNELINEFLADNKYILGVCNGVNVLSWARVGMSSPLDGKVVAVPDQFAPAQTYDSVYYGYGGFNMIRYAEDNGATVSPNNSIGNPSVATDDVAEDGLILTAQDNRSALAGGQRLAELLNE